MQQHNWKQHNFLVVWMVIAQWRAAEAVLVLDSQTSAGCRATTTATMKDAVATANAALPSKREVPVKLSRVPFSGRRTHSHLMKRHAATRSQRRLEICKTNAVPKEPISIPGLELIGRVGTCTANLSLVPVTWSRRRPKRWSSSVTVTISVGLDRFIVAAKLMDLKADWIRAPTCFLLTEQCMLYVCFCFIVYAFYFILHFFLFMVAVVVIFLFFLFFLIFSPLPLIFCILFNIIIARFPFGNFQWRIEFTSYLTFPSELPEFSCWMGYLRN